MSDLDFAPELSRDLLGEPMRNPKLSQYFTPQWLADRMGRWIPEGSTVLEPSCGRGNLVAGALKAGAKKVVGIDISRPWVEFCTERFSDPDSTTFFVADFLETKGVMSFDAVLMNPPYENNQALDHVLNALDHAERVICLVNANFEYSKERERLWRQARPVRRAILPFRPFPNAAQDYVVLEIMRVDDPAAPVSVLEERWLPEAA